MSVINVPTIIHTGLFLCNTHFKKRCSQPRFWVEVYFETTLYLEIKHIGLVKLSLQ